VLELEMKRLDIPVELDFPVERIEHHPEGMVVVSSKANKKIKCSSVIIAGGGKSYPALGSDGSAYKVAAALGHNIVEPVPSAVPLVVKDKLCHLAQGQRFDANLKAIVSGETVAESRGDLLITKYGISGTAVLDISREISIAINRNRSGDVWVHADIAPFIAEDALVQNIEESVRAGRTGADVFAGVLPYKVAAVLSGQLAGAGARKIASELKRVRFKVSGTRGWNEAEFTAGGVDTGQIDSLTMESKIRRGIYFAGEILDVDGRRGGYNLAWAWASGYIAGGSAA
jgi:predicted Rossmann fold flavoprotein